MKDAYKTQVVRISRLSYLSLFIAAVLLIDRPSDVQAWVVSSNNRFSGRSRSKHAFRTVHFQSRENEEDRRKDRSGGNSNSSRNRRPRTSNNNDNREHPDPDSNSSSDAEQSISKNKAISALSQPTGAVGGAGGTEGAPTQPKATGNSDNKSASKSKPPIQGSRQQNGSATDEQSYGKKLLPPSGDKVDRNRRQSSRTIMSERNPSRNRNPPFSETTSASSPPNNGPGVSETTPATEVFSSLLPPPLPYSMDDSTDGDSLTSGLSSWEEFLGAGANIDTTNTNNKRRKGMKASRNKVKGNTNISKGRGLKNKKVEYDMQQLPSIQDLFPPDLSSTGSAVSDSSPVSRLDSQPSLDGVLPVSDLFYRSSHSQDDETQQHDDEELPFSAEQSDAVSSENNKVRVRKNLAQQKQPPPQSPPLPTKFDKDDSPKSTISSTSSNSISSAVAIAATNSKKNRKRGRKMVRRGMEMLVGGVPINADPPQRCVELLYDFSPSGDWASAVSLNTRDFGPLLHTPDIPRVSEMEKGIFCEHFCHYAMKWDVCPKDLQEIVKSYQLQNIAQANGSSLEDDTTNRKTEDVASPTFNATTAASASSTTTTTTTGTAANTSAKSGINKVRVAVPGTTITTSKTNEQSLTERPEQQERDGGNDSGDGSDIGVAGGQRGKDDEFFETKGEFAFEIGLSRKELEAGDSNIFKSIFERGFKTVLERAMDAVAKRDGEGFIVKVSDLTLTEMDDGFTHVGVDFTVRAEFVTSLHDMERRMKHIGAAFAKAMDEGDVAVALAAAAREELRWPESIRNRVVEECLFQDDDGDEPVDSESHADDTGTTTRNDKKRSMDTSGPQNDLAGGAGSVFYDCSEKNILNSPYKGEIGLRLVEAMVERSKQRQPRVIAIGDVHGCIDELQDLLRQCDYSPGDLVVFLGDLVCKGPDSISVVQMAREIGAIGVRGNHDFEVIRWHQAIKSGVDPPVVGSEHFHIASCLSPSDMKWMYSLPWYFSSKDLDSLFVHAGFVSGIRLAKQNPRLMMNMRSILPDGTVTSKFFNNWPWARLWDGPQTVLFGHDADRGLQQYEHAIGLDTGCVYGGRLTACILPEKRLVSVSARREYFKYRRKKYD